jgi:hypothetical protein
MKVYVGGTPLESLGWQRDLGQVRIRWRDVPVADRVEFLEDLIVSAYAELEVQRKEKAA